LEDYVTLLSSMKSPSSAISPTPPVPEEKKESPKKDADLERYTAESS